MNALIENRREQKEGDRRMIEANEKTQLMYAAEKREKIILEQEQIIKDLQAKIASAELKTQNSKANLLWALFLVTLLSLACLFLV